MSFKVRSGMRCLLAILIASAISYPFALRGGEEVTEDFETDLTLEQAKAEMDSFSGEVIDTSVYNRLWSSDEWYLREIKNGAFGVGERLEFDINYGFINAGHAVLQVRKIVDCGGYRTYHIVSTARTNKFFSFFFKVDDRVESYVDVKGIFSHRFEKHLREGSFRSDRITNFDPVRHLAITGEDTIPTYPFVQDMLSAFYYARTLDIAVGEAFYIDNHTDRKNYPIEVKVYRKERVRVEAGSFDCLLLEPVLRTSTIFENKGKLFIWVTDDEHRMPVKLKSKVVIGSFTAELKEYTRGKISGG
jgi:hypothetical protein